MDFETLLPPALALCSAFLFGLGAQFTRLGLRTLAPAPGTLLQVCTAATLYWLFAPVFIDWRDWLAPAILLFAAVGLFRPLVSLQLVQVGTQHLGPTLTSTLAGVSPLFGVCYGALLFGERLTPAVLLGTAGIVIGIAALSWRRGSGLGTRGHRWPLWALALPLAAALVRSTGDAVAKTGMESVANPYFVGLVGYTVSSLAALAVMPEARRAIRFRGNPGVYWQMAVGVVYGISALLLNTALMHGRLVVVSPIIACFPLFSLILGLAVFREETIDRRAILTVALVVPSVVLITLRG